MDYQNPNAIASSPSIVHRIEPLQDLPSSRITSANGLEGFRIVQHLGVVRGIVVRSRSVIGQFAASLQMIFGGNITIYTELCERAREDAFRLMIDHAKRYRANAIVAMRYDATEVTPGVTEVLAYGTAVRVEPLMQTAL